MGIQLLNIEGATFVRNELTGPIRHFVISKDGEEMKIRIRGRRKEEIQDLYDELNHVWTFANGDVVDLVVISQPWKVGEKSGTLYYLDSIKKGS